MQRVAWSWFFRIQAESRATDAEEQYYKVTTDLKHNLSAVRYPLDQPVRTESGLDVKVSFSENSVSNLCAPLCMILSKKQFIT